MNKAQQIQNVITQRLQAAFPTANVKHGWIDTFWQNNDVWPLITVAPTASDPNYSNAGESIKDSISWAIYVLEQVEQPDTEISQLLSIYLKQIRKVLIAPVKDDRHNNYGGLLTVPPAEQTAARFIQPENGLPFAGLSFILTTTYSEKLE
ncbi:hypothetical protein [Rheinheimera salexigens]|uniref:Phage tail protein n=1 Tax=Rheinheimera salexigens TaxID=1628148 RepID=A0A1E7Q8E4_9GAMM|nr:hypothetical protein [Rheinheimera salexigens]OEY70333.1 hypothetical protein BI198_12700 [Rheinheimera salexigens]